MGVLAGTASLQHLRSMADGDVEARRAHAAALADLGLGGVLVSEADGGLGMGLLDAVVIQECLGRMCAPGFLQQAIGAYAMSGGDLRGVADLSVRPTVALSEVMGARDGAGISASGGALNGTALFVPHVEDSTHIICFDAEGAGWLVACADAVPMLMQTIDRSRTFWRIDLKNAKAVALPESAQARAMNAARVLVAADALGAMQAMLDRAVAYASEREQFGRVIGSFQAVKHMCAEMAARIEPARALVWHAAHALDMQEAEAPVMACHAKAHLAEVGTFVARTSTEVHGGMGFTDLLGLHYWFKRIGANRQLFGSPETTREAAARLQGFT